MTSHEYSYAVITPVRDEAANLRRLARSLTQQVQRPATWVLVDTGSGDETLDLGRDLAQNDPRIVFIGRPAEPIARGGPIVRAFNEGFKHVAQDAHVVIKVDADTSFDPDYFRRLLERFADDPALGIASGICHEQAQDGSWRPRYVTSGHVWGAARAYRRECLEQISPLEERMGWDGIDVYRAEARGWTTKAFEDLPFRHHRWEGEREGSARLAWAARGRAAHYMGYRPWFLVLRSLHHARSERAALAMIGGWCAAAIRREERCKDPVVRQYLRRQQAFGSLLHRAREATGRSPS